MVGDDRKRGCVQNQRNRIRQGTCMVGNVAFMNVCLELRTSPKLVECLELKMYSSSIAGSR
jgi:hypothetical protein